MRPRTMPAGIALVAAATGCSTIIGADFSDKNLCETNCPGAPTIVADSQTAPSAMASDSANIYWIDGTSIKKCALGGCQDSPVALASGVSASGITVDASNVYWVTTSGTDAGPGNPEGLLEACAISGCTAPTILASGLMFPSQSTPISVTTDGARVYWTNGTQVLACPNAGNCGTPTTVVDGQMATLVAVDAANVYFGNADTNGTIMTCTPGQCANPTILASGRGMPVAMAIDSKNLYWGTDAGAVLECAKAGCNQAPTVLAGGQFPRALAVDATTVYWVDDGDVSKCAIAGCGDNPTQLVSGFHGLEGIALSASNVFWTDNSDRQVSTFPK